MPPRPTVFKWALALSIFGICVSIGSVLLVTGTRIRKHENTILDLYAIGTRFETGYQRQAAWPITGKSFEVLKELLPDISAEHDPWGYPYRYMADETYACICSYGKDNLPGPSSGYPAMKKLYSDTDCTNCSTAFTEDVCWVNGKISLYGICPIIEVEPDSQPKETKSDVTMDSLTNYLLKLLKTLRLQENSDTKI